MVIYDNWWDALRFHGILWVKIGHAKNWMIDTENRLKLSLWSPRSLILTHSHVQNWRQFFKNRWAWWTWFSQLVTRLANHWEKWLNDVVFVLVSQTKLRFDHLAWLWLDAVRLRYFAFFGEASLWFIETDDRVESWTYPHEIPWISPCDTCIADTSQHMEVSFRGRPSYPFFPGLSAWLWKPPAYGFVLK